MVTNLLWVSDVSTLRGMFACRALDDISESIRELQFYRNNIFKKKTDEKKRKIIENGENEKTVSWCQFSCCRHVVLWKNLWWFFFFFPWAHADCLGRAPSFSALASPDYSSTQRLEIIFLLTCCFHLWHSSSFVSTRSHPSLGTYLYLLLDHFFCLKKKK